MAKRKKKVTSCKRNAKRSKTEDSGFKQSIQLYECPLCDLSFSDESSRTHHEKSHFQFLCRPCDVNFKDAEELQEHSLKVHNSESVKVPMENAVEDSSEEESYSKCNGQDPQRERNNQSNNHQNVSGENKFVEMKNIVHNNSHLEVSPNKNGAHICHICNKSFPDTSGKRLCEQIHLAKYYCPLCEMIFKSTEQFKEHILMKHRCKGRVALEENNGWSSDHNNISQEIIVESFRKNVDQPGVSSFWNGEDASTNILGEERKLADDLLKKIAWIECFLKDKFDLTIPPNLNFDNDIDVNWSLLFLEKSKAMKYPLLKDTLIKVKHIHLSLFDYVLKSEGTVYTKERTDKLLQINYDLSQILHDHCKLLNL